MRDPARVLLRVHRPGPPLDRLVELITYYEGFAPAHAREIVLPEGMIEVIIDLGDTPKKLYPAGGAAIDFRRAWVSGPRRGFIVIEAQPGASMAVIRFRPGGAASILRCPASALGDQVVHLEDVIDRAASSLRDRILEARGPEARIAAIVGWLLERAGDRRGVDPVIEHLARRLATPAGDRVAEVLAEVGYSPRHAVERFRQAIGLSPKRFARIARFHRVLGALARDPAIVGGARPEWALVAQRHGYYDQSHLIRDFRELAGITPGGYLAAHRGRDNYLPTA